MAQILAQPGQSVAHPTRLRPMPLPHTLLLFGVSALIFRLSIYGLMPSLMRAGVAPFWAFLISYGLVLSLMMLAAFVGLRVEGYRLTRTTFRERLRFRRLSGRAWAWTLGIFLAGFLATGALAPTAQMIARIPLFAPPDFLPAAVNPLVPQFGRLTAFMGVPLPGNWWVVIVYFVFLSFFNIFGEEVWFRGYMLPRQELVHGRWTWVLHGVLWTLFHVPVYPWYLIYLLPTTLSVTFAAQKLQNTWAAYIVHFIGNALLAMIPIVLGVAGIGG